MSELNLYDLEKYKSLSSLEDASNELKKKEPKFKELSKKIMDLAKSRKIELGLRLIHSHDIPLEDGQAMVENFGNYQDKPAETYPASWILCDNKYLVFEYSTDLRVKQVYEKLLEDSSALDEISAHIRQYNLDPLIGPCIIAREAMTKFDIGQGQVLGEDTVKVGDKYVNIIQSRPNEESKHIEALWGAKVNNFCMTMVKCWF
ncbi:1440_t:CDS:2, partial [Gigaspora margarita]